MSEEILSQHIIQHSLPWLHYTVIINVGVGLQNEKDVIIAENCQGVCVHMCSLGMHKRVCMHVSLCMMLQ